MWRFEHQGGVVYKIFNDKHGGPLYCACSPDGDGDRRIWVKARRNYNNKGDALWWIERQPDGTFKLINAKWRCVLYCSDSHDNDGDRKAWGKKSSRYDNKGSACWEIKQALDSLSPPCQGSQRCHLRTVTAVGDDDRAAASDLIGVDLPAGLAPDVVRALRLLAQQSMQGIDYASLGLGWHHPRKRTEYRRGRHESVDHWASRKRSERSRDALAELVRSMGPAAAAVNLEPDGSAKDKVVDAFVREIGYNRRSGPGVTANFKAVLAALEGELLMPLRAQNEGIEGMYTTHLKEDVPPKLVQACVAEIHTHVLQGDFSEWRYSNPVGARQLDGLSQEQIAKWTEPARTEHAGGIVVHEDSPGELGFFWATKIGGPSHGFDVEGQCLLPLLANARHKVVLVSDPCWPHHPAGRAHFRLLWTKASTPLPMLWLETVNCDFAASRFVNPRAWIGAVLRHAVAKADAMGVGLCLNADMGRALQGLPEVDDGQVKEQSLQFILRPSNGVVEASDYLSRRHDWVQIAEEVTDRLRTWVYTPESVERDTKFLRTS